ncbi:hypothetical protein PIB30_102238, partial [Stylosanthes scabra]|nr:hypothetical protein [Stylosanthes scabra]
MLNVVDCDDEAEHRWRLMAMRRMVKAWGVTPTELLVVTQREGRQTEGDARGVVGDAPAVGAVLDERR